MNMGYSVSGMSCGSGKYSAISIGTTSSPLGHGISNGAQISSVKNGSSGNGGSVNVGVVVPNALWSVSRAVTPGRNLGDCG